MFAILDPFVRLHRIGENASAEVAPSLAYLRDLQRRFALAVAVVLLSAIFASHRRRSGCPIAVNLPPYARR
jgi:hypothetical protein